MHDFMIQRQHAGASRSDTTSASHAEPRRRGVFTTTAIIAAFGLLAVSPASAGEGGGQGPDLLSDPALLASGALSGHADIHFRYLARVAHHEKRYGDALRLFRRASFYADKPSQAMIAEMHWTGEGAPRDPVRAYIWMDLAAERGYPIFLAMRERYWQQLTEAQRARVADEGREVYAEFGDRVALPRINFKLRMAKHSSLARINGGNVQISIDGYGMLTGDRFFNDEYWNPKKYWANQDLVWRQVGKARVTVGDIETQPKPDADEAPAKDEIDTQDERPR